MRFSQAILAVLPLVAAPALAETDLVRHRACLQQAAAEAEVALEDARSWQTEGGGPLALHCEATALIGLGDFAAAAALFESLGESGSATHPLVPATLFAQAAQAWLLAGDLSRAGVALDTALALRPGDVDLLLDRANLSALQGDYWGAIDDLNHAEDLAPGRASIFLLRATAYRFLVVLDLAAADIERALALAPNSVEAYLERGNIRRLTGDAAGARADWLEVLKRQPEGIGAEAARANLESLDVQED